MNILKLLIGTVSIAIFLGGCAYLNDVSGTLNAELNAPLFGSKVANANPSTSSLVIVKAEAIRHGALQWFDKEEEKQDIKSGVLLSTDGAKRIDGYEVDGLIIFVDLPPGAYNLARVSTTEFHGGQTKEFIYNVSPEQVGNLIFDTKLGEAKFLGVVMIDNTNKQGKRQVIFDLKPSREAEIAALEKFVQHYNNTPWVNAVQKRIAELKK